MGGVEGLPACGAFEVKAFKVIHASPAEAGISEGKACGLNDCEFQAEAGAEPADGGSIGGNVGLVEGDFDGHSQGFS